MKKLCLSVLALAALGLAPATADVSSSPRTLQVTGTAEVSVEPDICYMRFVITTEHKTSAKQAYRDNNRTIEAVASAIKSQDVAAKDVQTQNLTISPRYHWDDKHDRQIFEGYSVAHTLYVKLRKIDKASDVLDAAVEAGATQVTDVSFTVENPKKYLAEARIEAIKAAKTKAEAMAEAAGVQLLKPTSISEQEPYGWQRYMAQSNVSLERMVAGSAGEAALEPGEVKLSHTVTITYEIK